MDPQQKAIAEEFDRYNSKYSEAVNAALLVPGMNVDYFTRVKSEYLVDLTREVLGETTALSALDIGCGVGNYHGLIKGRFGSIDGCDVSSESIERARTRHPDLVYQSYDGSRLPYDDGTFDVAFTICVMHHVPPPAWTNFVREMRRVLRKGGLALVFEHNPYNPLTMKVVNRCPFDADAVLLKPHVTKGLFNGAGFRDIQVRSILNIPSFGPFTRRIDRIVGRLPSGAQYFLSART
ncbi:class I SAM-dependent methyltransferase [Microvirga sp. VF16]|uniref:class I SAM-dependent methyltransferase n=1 Tax=Microvirga sp. VF16 TaxID=2807101 RepID=UPI00193D38F9|nr:class I SAM-dependent methyltransferase [Microvirga sp. VF16]QRM28275.1 class I SAM-dependent methyltransferase [Microvirga sp. VF16]